MYIYINAQIIIQTLYQPEYSLASISITPFHPSSPSKVPTSGSQTVFASGRVSFVKYAATILAVQAEAWNIEVCCPKLSV